MNKKNKYIKIINILPSLNIGGAQKSLLAISDSDHNYNIKRKVITIISKDGALKNKFIKKNIKHYNCPIILNDNNWRPYRLFKVFRKLGSCTFSLRLLFYLFKDDSQIVCSNDGTRILTQIITSLLSGKKFIWIINTEEIIIKKKYMSLINILLKYKFIKIISISKAILQKNFSDIVKENNILNNNLHIIPSGRNINLFYNEIKNREKNKKYFKIKKDEIIIGTIGRLHWSKGYSKLLKSFFQIKNEFSKNVKLFIAGDGPLKKDLSKLIKDLNLHKEVELLGFISDIPQFLVSLDLYVQPSISEGLCGSVIEAISANVPVVVSNTGGLKELISNNNSGLIVKYNNVESLTETLIKMINMSKFKKDQMIKNAYRKIQPFEINKIAAQYNMIYNDVLQIKD